MNIKNSKLLLSIIAFALIFTALTRCTSNQALTSAITPTFKSFDVAYQTLVVSAAKGGEYVMENGTKITFPKNCFVDSDGNTIEGNVELKYREFHSIADVLASGIPMAYNEGTESGHLATAGMIEIKPTANNGTEITIAGGKEINFEMVSYNDPDNVDFFALNEENGVWTKTGTPDKKPLSTYNQLLDSLKKIEIIKAPLEPKKTDESTPVIRFKVSDNTGALADFQNIVWQYAGKDVKFDPFLNDAFNNGDYRIIEAKIIDTDLNTLQVTMELESKITDPETNEKIKKTDSLTTWFSPVFTNRTFEAALEIFKDKEQQFKLLMDKKQKLNEMLENTAKVTRAFAINKFGYFNCDVWMREPFKEFEYQFTQNGEVYDDPATVYLVNQQGGKNSVLNIGYSPNSVKSMRLFLNGQNKMVVVLPGDKVKIFEHEEMKAIKNDQSNFMNLSIDNYQVVKSLKEIEELF